jgi:hypothetical protein
MELDIVPFIGQFSAVVKSSKPLVRYTTFGYGMTETIG